MPKNYYDMTPEERKKADKEADEGGYNEATEADNLFGPDEPEPEAKPKPKTSPDRPYKKVSPDRPYKKMAKGGKVKAAKGRGDGCCVKGKTKGRFV
jgi:hypothetical protein